MKPNQDKTARRRAHAAAQRQSLLEAMRFQADIHRVVTLMQRQPHLNDTDIARETGVDVDAVRQLRSNQA